MGLRIEPPPQIDEFNYIWRRWIYGLYQSLNQEDAWIEPALDNGWVNVGGEFNDAGYMLDALGFVHMKGSITNATIAATAAFTLPAGYRPQNTEMFFSMSINSAGEVIPIEIGSNTRFLLDGIIFQPT